MPMRNAQALLALPHEQMVAIIHHWNRKNIADTQCWNFWERDDQAAPLEDWRIWLVMAGRGYGKTRMGAEWVSGLAALHPGARFALVGATLNEARAVMVEGESGLLSLPFAERPTYEPSLRRLTWRNMATATLFSAAEPESLRGPQHDFAWADEIAKWPSGIAAWDNLMLGLRLGDAPRAMATTTPRPVPLVRRLATEKGVVVTRGRTTDNAQHLPPEFIAAMHTAYAGTHAGWKRAAILCKIDDQWTDIGHTAPSAIMGVTRNPLPAHPAFLLDQENVVDVELLNSAMALPLRDASPLTNHAPVFWIEGEFVRVGCIEALGGQLYRLSRLSRGVFASALQAPAHPSGALAVLMDPAAALMLPNAAFSLGDIVQVEAQGLGDTVPVSATAPAEGRAVTPLSPVHGSALRNPDGSVDLKWKRRSRLDLGWIDGVDQAQAEDAECYRVTLHVNDVVIREWTVGANKLHIPAADIATLDMPQNAQLSFAIRHIGRFAQSNVLNVHI